MCTVSRRFLCRPTDFVNMLIEKAVVVNGHLLAGNNVDQQNMCRANLLTNKSSKCEPTVHVLDKAANIPVIRHFTSRKTREIVRERVKYRDNRWKLQNANETHERVQNASRTMKSTRVSLDTHVRRLNTRQVSASTLSDNTSEVTCTSVGLAVCSFHSYESDTNINSGPLVFSQYRQEWR